MTTQNKKTYYRIEGGAVQVVEETVKETIETKDFLEAIRSQSGISTGILPKDCFFYQRQIEGSGRQGEPSRESSLWVIQKEPRNVNVSYKHCPASSSEAPMKRLKISLPFVLFFIVGSNDSSIGQVYTCCTKTKIKSMDDQIFVLPLPNQYDSGHGNLCTGSIRLKSKGPIQEKVEEMCTAFWASDFNTDLGTNYPRVLVSDDGYNGMEMWAEKTKANPFYGVSDEMVYENHTRGTMKGMISGLGFPT
jgi:hypothetical protein